MAAILHAVPDALPCMQQQLHVALLQKPEAQILNQTSNLQRLLLILRGNKLISGFLPGSLSCLQISMQCLSLCRRLAQICLQILDLLLQVPNRCLLFMLLQVLFGKGESLFKLLVPGDISMDSSCCCKTALSLSVLRVSKHTDQVINNL